MRQIMPRHPFATIAAPARAADAEDVPGWELLDDEGRPLAAAAPAERDPLDRDPPTLPWWLDPRKSSGRTVLYCLFVILGAWILSARQGTPVDTGPGTDGPTAVAQPATVSTPHRPAVLPLAALGRLSGPARTAALLLDPPGTGLAPNAYEAPVRWRPRQARAAAVLREHLQRFRVRPGPAEPGRDAGHCALVLRADRGSSAVAVSVAAGTRRTVRATTRWQVLVGPRFTFEWVQRVDAAGRTVLVAAYGASSVPGLGPLFRLASDPRLAR
jgi:hypothetical protein